MNNSIIQKKVSCRKKIKRYNLKMKFLISLFFFLVTPQFLFAKVYNLEWYGELKHSQSIEFPGKSIYKIINSFGYWEDNKGNYGSLNCLG